MQWVLAVLVCLTCALPVASAAPGAGFRDVPNGHWAQRAIAQVAAKGVMPAKAPGTFRPDQVVTRAELAGILVRVIDHLEKSGSRNVSQSPAKPHVPRKQRQALARLPRRHSAYAAISRLVEGGYLVPDIHGDYFMPTAQNLDRPVTPNEVRLALAGIAVRVTEKRVGVEHPESLKEGHRLEPGEERPTIPRGQKPHRHAPDHQH
jgi:hypothetical protein